MTWQELADFINNEMPKWERNQEVSVWDSSVNNNSAGHFFTVDSVSWYDEEGGHKDRDNFHSLNINTEDWW